MGNQITLLLKTTIFWLFLPNLVFGNPYSLVTTKGNALSYDGRRLKILESAQDTAIIRIRKSSRWLKKTNIHDLIGKPVTVTGLKDRYKIAPLIIKSDVQNLYRFNSKSDSIKALRLKVSLDEYQIVEEMNFHRKRKKLSRSASVASFIWGTGWIVAGSVFFHDSREGEYLFINGDAILAFVFTLAGTLSIARGGIYLTSSVFQDKKYKALSH